MTIRWLFVGVMLALAGVSAAPAAEADTDVAARVTAADVPCVGVGKAVYHRLDCRDIGETKPEDREFFPSCANAVEKGYLPCPRCRPPVIKRPRWAPAKPEIQRLFVSDRKRVMRVQGTPVAGRWFLVTARKPWISTRIQVVKGQIICIQAGGRIALRSGTAAETVWDPDGLNRQGKPSSSWGWRRRYYLQGRLAGKTSKVGGSYFGVAAKSGVLELGVRCPSGDREHATGMFKAFVAVLEPGAKLLAPGKPSPGGEKTGTSAP